MLMGSRENESLGMDVEYRSRVAVKVKRDSVRCCELNMGYDRCWIK